jgi:hypothetical protein
MRVKLLILILTVPAFLSSCRKLPEIDIDNIYSSVSLSITQVNNNPVNLSLHDTIICSMTGNRATAVVRGTSKNVIQKIDNGSDEFHGYSDFKGKIYMLVKINKTHEAGGWYIQSQPATIDEDGNWEATIYIGDSTDKPPDIILFAYCTDEIRTMNNLIYQQNYLQDFYRYTLAGNLPTNSVKSQEIYLHIIYWGQNQKIVEIPK